MSTNDPSRDPPFRQWLCVTCGFVYDEAIGQPDAGITAGTRWTSLPDDWVCPLCGAPKSDFELVE